jgi:hypothetical protein
MQDGDMSRSVTKGLLGAGLAGLIIWISAMVWNGANPIGTNEEPLQGNIAAFTDTSATRTHFWVYFEPPRPDSGAETGNIRFVYRLHETPTPEPTTVSFVLSGRYAEMLTTCATQSIDINRNLRFEDLPTNARLALTALKQRGQQVGAQDAAGLVDKLDAANQAATNQNYTRVTIPVVPTMGGSTEDAKVLGAENNHRCGANFNEFWKRTSGGYRILTPPVAAAVPVATASVKIWPGVKVETDDKFYILRSTSESEQSGNLTETKQTTNSLGSSEGFDNVVAGSMASTYTSNRVQDEERNSTLVIGVMLGAAASILVAVLSGAFDLVARRRVAAPVEQPEE